MKAARCLWLGMSSAVVLSVLATTALAADGRSGAVLGRDPSSGRLIFVGADPGRALPSALAGATTALPEQNSLSFVRTYASQLGLRDVDTELSAFSTAKRTDGRTVVRYRQVHEGVPIFGADVVVNTDRNGALLAMSAKISPAPSVATEPKVSAEDAAALAVQLIAKYNGVAADRLTATTPELWIYDPNILLPGTNRPLVLTWKLEVRDGGRIRELVLVNAERGSLALHFNQIDVSWGVPKSPSGTVLSRARGSATPTVLGTSLLSVYDMNQACRVDDLNCTSTVPTGVLPGDLVCDNTTASACSTDSDAQDAYQFGLDTYDFYAAHHSRDSIDNAGMRLVFSVHYGMSYANAYWNGTQMVFGDGFSAADDVVGHELTHGVTENTSGLIYYGQPGAINESFSDIWGEFVDQTNGHGTDTTAVRWLMGEDLPIYGAGRNMKNPPAFGDPDSMLSTYYYVGLSDNAGVHWNSGVNNKAAYLMTDGGTFGGKTVAGLGYAKTAAIYYEAQTNLIGSGTNYIDLYYALRQACLNLMGSHGIAESDCQSVRDATDAVAMNKTKSQTVYPTVDYCPAGRTVNPAPLFNDDLEAGPGNWGTGVYDGASSWFLDSARNDSSSGSTALVWLAPTPPSPEDPVPPSDSYVAMAADVALPAGSQPFLRFEHDMWGFESPYDGGLVEYSTDGGSTWLDLGPKFAGGKNYSVTLSTLSDNPLPGRKAFGGYTKNYTESLYNLATLAGRSFRVRFRAASDSSGVSDPWFVDDIRIYTCVTTPSKPTLQQPANNALVTDYTPTLNWTDSSAGVTDYNVQIATDAAFTAVEYDVSGLGTSEFTLPADLAPNTKYYWRVRSLNDADDSLGWTAALAFRTAITAPVLLSPADTIALHSRRPTFDWDDVVGASGYTVQVATSPAFTTLVHTGTITQPISTYTPAVDLPANATLFWRVRAGGANGPSLHSLTRSFLTGNPPSVPVLVSPGTNALTTDYTPRLDWAVATVPVGTTLDYYQVQVADNAAFSAALDVNVNGLASHEYTLATDLAPNTTFYWRVRSWNGVGDSSAWSAVRTFRTAVLAPTLTAPADTTNVQSRRPAFDWGDVTGATGYTLQVSRVATFASIVLTGTVATATSTYTPTVDLPAATLLYWRVRANGPNGPGLYSTVWSITTGNPPSVPVLALPAANALTTDYTPRLDWAAVTLPAGTAFDHYQVQVDDNADFSSTTIDASVAVLATHEYTPAVDLAANTTFAWRVRAFNAAGDASAWSAVRTFRTAVVAPTLTSPADGGNVQSRRPVFDWDDVTGATGYTVQVAAAANFAAVLLTGTVKTATSTYTPTVDLPASKLLYWRVRANGPNGPGLYSTVWSVTTGNPPSVPVLSAPAANALTTDYTPRLDWAVVTVPAGTTFDHYQVQVADNAGFSGATEADVSGLAAHEYTLLTDLAANTTFYWRVRSWNAAGDASAWSAVRTFRTALAPPPLVQPADAEVLHTRRPVFDGGDVSGATGYTLQISRAATFGTLVLTGTITNAAFPTFTPAADLPAGTLLYWRVRANGANGPSAWSAVRSFTTSNPPSTPVLVSPGDYTIVADTTPTLDWNQVTVPAGTAFDHYEVELNATNGAYSSNTPITSLSAHQYTVASALPTALIYAWRVRAWNTAGDSSEWSVARQFYIPTL